MEDFDRRSQDTLCWRIFSLKGSSYRQWAETVKEYAKTHQEEKDYWVNVLSDYEEENKLRKLEKSQESNHQTITLTQEHTKKLLEQAMTPIIQESMIFF